MSEHSGADSGLERYGDELDAVTVDAVRTWAGDPELGKLAATLTAITDREKFLDTYAEAVVARHLQQCGCRVRADVLTPAGRTCDFEVSRDGRTFYLHVKRLNPDRPAHRRLRVSSRLRYLERIPRPYIVSVQISEGLGDDATQRFVTQAAAFLQHARVGDELVLRDDEGSEVGRCRMVAPGPGPRVSVVLGLPRDLGDEAPRARRLMRKAYRQFMPGQVNVILVCSGHPEDAEDVATALLGSHVERWDAPPPRGHRVAHGRGADGFWHGRQAPESRAAGWFHFTPGIAGYHGRLWMRPGAEPAEPMRSLLEDLFGEGTKARRGPPLR